MWTRQTDALKGGGEAVRAIGGEQNRRWAAVNFAAADSALGLLGLLGLQGPISPVISRSTPPPDRCSAADAGQRGERRLVCVTAPHSIALILRRMIGRCEGSVCCC